MVPPYPIWKSDGFPLPYMEQVLYGPPYLIWNRYHMVPPLTCMVPLTVNDSIPPHLIWNRYLMVPPYFIWNMHCMVPPYLILNRYRTLPPNMYDMIFSGQLRVLTMMYACFYFDSLITVYIGRYIQLYHLTTSETQDFETGTKFVITLEHGKYNIYFVV